MYAHVSEGIEMNLKNRNCGVRITIHQRFLFVQLQQCVIAVYNSNKFGIYYAYKSLGRYIMMQKTHHPCRYIIRTRPMTLPRISMVSVMIGSMASFSGWRR